MFFRIPDEFLLGVKKINNLEAILFSDEYRSDKKNDIEEQDPFEEADEEFIRENVNQ